MKDRLTPIAIGAALFCVFAAMIIDGGSPAVLFKPAPLILVFGGTFAASVAGIRKIELGTVRAIFKLAMGHNPPDLHREITTMVEMAQLAKSGAGVLSLENRVRESDDAFLRLGVQLVIDGSSSEEIREILETEIAAMQERHRLGAKFFSDLGGFAPTLGILGTVIGLVHVLSNLSTPGALGPAIASAFTATLWGVLSANLFWLPISNKLKRLSAAEVQAKQMDLEGLLAIQSGTPTRMVRTRMETFLPAAARATAPQRERVQPAGDQVQLQGGGLQEVPS
jgi:chemotaxis protein MotA